MTGPPQEVELKFICTPPDLAAVLAAAPAGDDQTRDLISVYFDTPGHALQKAGVSLRVRESQGRRVQTLKRGSGLRREEHEASIEGLTPDLALGPLKSLLPQGERLKPAFNVRVSRRQRTLRYQGAEIEIALDQGEVSGGRARSEICEVELELKSGPPEALFALAAELLSAAPLYLSFDGKASQGQAMMAGGPPSDRRSAAVALRRKATVAEAFQAVARGALAQIVANAAVLRRAPEVEAVHQLRVGARRLRSALSTFKPVVQDEALASIKAELKWLGAVTGKARNLDVFAQTVLSPAQAMPTPPSGLPALTQAIAGAREAAHMETSAAVSTDRFRRQVLELSRWIETGAWQSKASAGRSAAAFAAKALTRRRRKLLKRAAHLDKLDDERRHRGRIEAKTLRYALDGFASLYPAGRVGPFRDRLKALQAELGALNDIATAGPLLARLDLTPEAAFAAGELAGLRTALKPRLIARAMKAYDHLAEADRFWGR